MTVRLLKPYAQRPVGAIATFDASTEAAMIEAGQASANLAGGFEYFLPRPGLPLQSPQVAVGSLSLLSAEQSRLVLPEGQVLNVSGGAGSVGRVHRLDPVDGFTQVQSWVVGDGKLAPIGPFSGQQRFLVNCTSGSVTAAPQSASLAAPQIAYDAAGNMAGLAGPNGVVSLRQVAGMPRLAIAGDSTTDILNASTGNGATMVAPGIARITFDAALPGGSYWPGDEVRASAAPIRECNTMAGVVTSVDPARMWVEYTCPAGRGNGVIGDKPNLYRRYSTSSTSHISQAFAQQGMRFVLSVDAAIGGGDSEQIGEVLARDWVDSDIAIYGPGMNDIYSRGWGFERIKASDIFNLKIMRRAARLVLLGVPPRRSTATGWSAGAFAVWRQVNEWRRAYASTIGADFVDMTAADLGGMTYADPASATADAYIATATQTISADGVHPVALGAAVLGGGIARSLRSIPAADFLPASASLNVAQGYLPVNPLMKRDVGGTAVGAATFQNLAGAAGAEVADTYELKTTGGSAATVVKAGIVQRSKAVHGDSLGNAQRVIVDNSAPGAVAVVVTLSTASFHASMVDGDSLEYGMALLLSAASTPGSGNPDGLIRLTVGFNDQHLVAGNKFGAAIAGDTSTGRLPGHTLTPWKIDRTRRVAVAGAFSSSIVSVSWTVPALATACLDVGRVLARRFA
ncbi:SGNH/GDSL hydrolase family protein [Janthinobacterium sp. PLB04]|uniref:SGNH/GDSL hydrolase family protein n=1 Tax=Janthinobacterium lividum TaxID=29581 RepID=A0AAJ4MVF6_9BURK|nr:MULTISPECIES: SGNH/GDSL hydrolase family protein [Janthinobacterium]KAB0331765.1 SGNH/GDSL hydrolase family protein [Janthinobacterium lividum]QSX97964.1 SGNH/GDSL hydrolase family protein [Janthinobacterium lividum]UGQ37935.1 SGNH/GDSL hydrolase family protein [Janthinobacterium sp. PLB04]